MRDFYKEQKTKVCVKCGIKKYLNAFGKGGTDPEGRIKTCRDCLPTKRKPYSEKSINYLCKTGEY